MNSHRSVKTVVVGGGIWGLSTAYHLAIAGQRDVVVIERGPSVAAETTRRAAGQIGQLRTNPLLVRAINYTLDLMREFKDKTGHDPHYTQSGSLHVALNAERAEFFQEQIGQARALGIEVETATSSLISQLVPNLNQAAIESAVYVPNDGYVEAEKCALAYAAAVNDLGIEVLTNTELIGVAKDDDRVTSVETSNGTIECEQLIVTVGPWARRVLLLAGIHIPMQPIRLQQARTAKVPELNANHPVVRIPDESCYLRPEKGGYLYGCFDANPKSMDLAALPAEFVSQDIPPDPELVGNSRRRLAPIIPILDELDIDQYRQGMVGGTVDGRFVIGPVPQLSGVYVATGCGGTGIAASAAVGRWLANWATSGSPGDTLDEFAPDRFAEKAEQDDWVREHCEETFRNYYALPPK
ncbi:MAG: glycine/D-amino acid oxidase-like deaminating enzyme [Pirellulaceae bacterium]|jgi:glycine/D-amino acid oxidase-like deaminating enzyme